MANLKKFIIVTLLTMMPLSVTDKVFASPKPILAVMSLQTSGGVDSSITVPLSDKLRQELLRTRRFVVVTRSEMDRIVTEQTLQLSDCTSNECVVRMGQILGAEKMVSGRISKLGRKFVLAAELIDVETARIDRAASVECDCPVEELTRPIGELAARLAGVGYRPTEQAPTAGEGGFGMLEVKSDPLGATVFLDGIEAGSTPVLIEDVSAGNHEIELVHGEKKGRRTVEITADRVAKVSLELRPDPAKISISSVPSEAMVFFDNHMIGRTPLIVSDLEPGEHTIALHYELYQKLEETITVGPGEEVRREFQMQLASFLTVTSKPVDAALYINGEHYGVTGDEIELPPGEYRIAVRLPNHLPFDTTVSLVEGQAFDVAAELQINPAWLTYREDYEKYKVWQYGSLVVTAMGVAATVVAATEMNAAQKDAEKAHDQAAEAITVSAAREAEDRYDKARQDYNSYAVIEGISLIVLAAGIVGTYYADRYEPEKPISDFPVAAVMPSLKLAPERTVLSLGIKW